MIRLPKLIAMIEAGKRNVKPTHNKLSWLGAWSDCPSDWNSGTNTNTIGAMKIDINSRRRVNALRSFLIKAASLVEKPNLPSNPVLGA